MVLPRALSILIVAIFGFIFATATPLVESLYKRGVEINNCPDPSRNPQITHALSGMSRDWIYENFTQVSALSCSIQHQSSTKVNTVCAFFSDKLILHS
jgi:hypothetical protein